MDFHRTASARMVSAARPSRRTYRGATFRDPAELRSKHACAAGWMPKLHCLQSQRNAVLTDRVEVGIRRVLLPRPVRRKLTARCCTTSYRRNAAPGEFCSRPGPGSEHTKGHHNSGTCRERFQKSHSNKILSTLLSTVTKGPERIPPQLRRPRAGAAQRARSSKGETPKSPENTILVI